MKTFFEKLFDSLLKEIARSVLAPVGTWLGSIISLAAPTLILGWQMGFDVLRTEHKIPGWIIAITPGIFLLMSFFLVRQGIKISRLEPSKERTFPWGGLDWILTEEFRRNYRHVQVQDMSVAFLKSNIRGPFCPHCKRDVSTTLKRNNSDACIFCSKKFDLEPFEKIYQAGSSDPILQLRKLVYIEAQAAARRNEI